MNELNLLAQVVLCFGGLLLVKKFFKKEGIFAWITLATCLAEIQTSKTVSIFGWDCCMGTVLFASTFLATDMLRESYGEEESKKGPFFALMGAVIYIIFALLTPLGKPVDYCIAVQDAMQVLFSVSLRITIASVIMLFIANIVDVKLYNYLYKKTDGKKMWLRNNVCTIISNGLENYLFVFLGFFRFRCRLLRGNACEREGFLGQLRRFLGHVDPGIQRLTFFHLCSLVSLEPLWVDLDMI